MAESHYVTAFEASVIARAAAAGQDTVELDVRYGQKVVKQSFCGLCGRMVHHPSCPATQPIERS